jgi:DNA-binding response OmpR family regulator
MNKMGETTVLNGLQVFLVEDEPDIRVLFTFIFEMAGAKVIAAESITQALKLLEDHKPDILISDFQLPDGDGCSLIKELRKREAQSSKGILAVALTGMTGETDRVKMLEAGFQKYASKPIDPNALIELVANLAYKDEELR